MLRWFPSISLETGEAQGRLGLLFWRFVVASAAPSPRASLMTSSNLRESVESYRLGVVQSKRSILVSIPAAILATDILHRPACAPGVPTRADRWLSRRRRLQPIVRAPCPRRGSAACGGPASEDAEEVEQRGTQGPMSGGDVAHKSGAESCD